MLLLKRCDLFPSAGLSRNQKLILCTTVTPGIVCQRQISALLLASPYFLKESMYKTEGIPVFFLIPREMLLVKSVPGIRLYSQFLLRVDTMTALEVGLNEAI